MMRTAITSDVVGDKQVPLLNFPDGSRIHLAPWRMSDGGQDPVAVLQRWLLAWIREAARKPLGDAWSDLGQWVRLATWQREELPHNQNVCPTQVGIDETERIRSQIQAALLAMRSDDEFAG